MPCRPCGPCGHPPTHLVDVVDDGVRAHVEPELLLVEQVGGAAQHHAQVRGTRRCGAPVGAGHPYAFMNILSWSVGCWKVLKRGWQCRTSHDAHTTESAIMHTNRQPGKGWGRGWGAWQAFHQFCLPSSSASQNAVCLLRARVRHVLKVTSYQVQPHQHAIVRYKSNQINIQPLPLVRGVVVWCGPEVEERAVSLM